MHNKMYLSYGGGVNSTALLLLVKEWGWNPEVVYADHGGDWPETGEYIRLLIARGHKITILKPEMLENGKIYNDLYEYCWHHRMIPSRRFRWCTDKFKVRRLNKYFEPPAFSLIGIDAGEEHRAKCSVDNGIEKRYPLVEIGIDRDGCKKIILDHGLPLPMKSGCYFCPYQRKSQWKKLYREHPYLFCKVKALENRMIEARKKIGKGPLHFYGDLTLDETVNSNQEEMFDQPTLPCSCGL